MSEITFTADEKLTLQTAAHGAVGLMAAAKPGAISSTKAAIAAGKALSTATGAIGHVLAEKPKGMKLDGKSTADVADQVLPALTAAVALLNDKDPKEAANFRDAIAVATGEAVQVLGGGPAVDTMARKINNALNAA